MCNPQTELFVAERPVKKEPTWAESLRAIVTASWLNLLLVFIPVGWALHFTHQNDTSVSLCCPARPSTDEAPLTSSPCTPTVIFVFTFLAIIPLAKLLGYGTEELALRVGQTLGGRTWLPVGVERPPTPSTDPFAPL